MAIRKRAIAQRISRSVARSLLKHGARGAEKVVVIYQNGVPSKVVGYEEYQRMKDRRGRAPPDPLGAVDGKVLRRLSRESIYE